MPCREFQEQLAVTHQVAGPDQGDSLGNEPLIDRTPGWGMVNPDGYTV
ncbi:MAG TPA: hypothetical protein VEK77_05015 [Gemmatimonadales bacterium]|nr:hypothetical protein [Gemmatimonadales bacterium]